MKLKKKLIAVVLGGATSQQRFEDAKTLLNYGFATYALHTVEAAESYAAGKPWTRVIWDVTAVAWLLNDGERFMRCRLERCPRPMYDKTYAPEPYAHDIGYVYYVDRDALFEDLFRKLGGTV